jgi:uncharacterized membrane protein YeaQ/YmgE (transglycosylase-associated protein family)
MTLFDFIILLLVAAVCGTLGQAVAGYTVGGCLVSALVGFIGAFLGMWLARQLGLPEFFAFHLGGENFPILWSIIGSAILALVLGWFSRSKYRSI